MRVHYEIRMEKLFRNINVHMYVEIYMHTVYVYSDKRVCHVGLFAMSSSSSIRR